MMVKFDSQVEIFRKSKGVFATKWGDRDGMFMIPEMDQDMIVILQAKTGQDLLSVITEGAWPNLSRVINIAHQFWHPSEIWSPEDGELLVREQEILGKFRFCVHVWARNTGNAPKDKMLAVGRILRGEQKDFRWEIPVLADIK